MFFFQEQIMIFAWKSNIFDPFSVLDLNPNEIKEQFSKSAKVRLIYDCYTLLSVFFSQTLFYANFSTLKQFRDV
jgi:hypothetical protein